MPAGRPPRQFIQHRSLRREAAERLSDYDAIMGGVRAEMEKLRDTGIPCGAFRDDQSEPIAVAVTRLCWNHLFKHPHKRRSRVEKLERALCLPLVLKLLKRTTTYQEVSRERDKGGNDWLYFGVVGYVRGNRIKAVIRKQNKVTDPKYVLFSFYQTSSAYRTGDVKEE